MAEFAQQSVGFDTQHPKAAGVDAAAFGLRQLPEAGHHRRILGPLAQQQAVAAPHQNHGQLKPLDLLLGFLARALELRAGAERQAIPCQRADQALWPARRTQGGPQLHDSLVVVPVVAAADAFEQLLRAAGESGPGGRARHLAVVVEQAREDANDVPVDHRVRPAEGDAGDRRGGVAADAGQRLELFVGAREDAAVFGDDAAGGLLHLARAAVVSQAAPTFQQLGFGGLGQCLDRRKTFQETLVVGNHRADPRLLQHDLGNPDTVGIGGFAPRQDPAVALVPGQQPLAQAAIGQTAGQRSFARLSLGRAAGGLVRVALHGSCSPTVARASGRWRRRARRRSCLSPQPRHRPQVDAADRRPAPPLPRACPRGLAWSPGPTAQAHACGSEWGELHWCTLSAAIRVPPRPSAAPCALRSAAPGLR